VPLSASAADSLASAAATANDASVDVVSAAAASAAAASAAVTSPAAIAASTALMSTFACVAIAAEVAAASACAAKAEFIVGVNEEFNALTAIVPSGPNADAAKLNALRAVLKPFGSAAAADLRLLIAPVTAELTGPGTDADCVAAVIALVVAVVVNEEINELGLPVRILPTRAFCVAVLLKELANLSEAAEIDEPILVMLPGTPSFFVPVTAPAAPLNMAALSADVIPLPNVGLLSLTEIGFPPLSTGAPLEFLNIPPLVEIVGVSEAPLIAATICAPLSPDVVRVVTADCIASVAAAGFDALVPADGKFGVGILGFPMMAFMA
jgi:hypothetical protein